MAILVALDRCHGRGRRRGRGEAQGALRCGCGAYQNCRRGPEGNRAPHGQDYDDYTALLAPIVSLPAPELADTDLYARAARFLGGDQTTLREIQHVDGPVWRSVQTAGTANCQTERFFSVRPDGALSAIETPGVFGDLCWSSYRQVGRADGRPALIEQEIRQHPLLGVDVEITPWRSGKRETCQVAIRFNDAFHVTERFCKDQPVCQAAEPLVPKLAEALARESDGTTLASIAPPPDQGPAATTRLARAKEILESGRLGDGELPTFGRKPATRFPIYGGSPQLTVITLAGETLIGRVGIGGVGWRELGDYLITLYKGDGDNLDPVASFVVERRNTGLHSVTTSVLTPPDNLR